MLWGERDDSGQLQKKCGCNLRHDEISRLGRSDGGSVWQGCLPVRLVVPVCAANAQQSRRNHEISAQIELPGDGSRYRGA
jgi:hypothetical protein